MGRWAMAPLPSQGVPNASHRGTKLAAAHKWADWLRHPCHLRVLQRLRAGEKIKKAPEVGSLATSPLPPEGSPMFKSRAQSQKTPTSGQIGYIDHDV